MAKSCGICLSARRAEIEKDMLAGVPYRELTAKYGFSATTHVRHRKDHVFDQAVVQAANRSDVVRAESVIDQVVELKDKALGILRKAEAAKSYTIALNAIKEARATMELLAKITGELRTGVNITISPEWVTLRTLIVGVLERFPEAADALVDAMKRQRLDRYLDAPAHGEGDVLHPTQEEEVVDVSQD